MNKICVTNENFEDSVTAVQSKGFVGDILYRFLYDKLEPKYKKYLKENDLPKDKILIYLTKSSDNRDIVKKYKGRIKFLTPEVKVSSILNDVFRGQKNRQELIEQLSKFENRHILMYLESTSATSFKVARITSNIDKYIYSKFFVNLVVNELYGCGAIVQWIKKKD